MKPAIERRLALVTGAGGGIGKACARELGKSRDLVLTDISDDRLKKAEEDLLDEGYTVVDTVAGDLAEQAVIGRIVSAVKSNGRFGALLHAAGVSSGMADWQTIIRANVIGTRRLLDAIDPLLEMGSVGVLIASIAGYFTPPNPEMDTIMASALEPGFMDRFEPLLRLHASANTDASFNYSGLSGPAYGVSKRATIREAAMRAPGWATRGARIVSISPGIIWTPMGRFEVEHGEAAADVLQETPLLRWGTAMDIAEAASFLMSDKASFITGADLRVDGGMVPARLGDAV